MFGPSQAGRFTKKQGSAKQADCVACTAAYRCPGGQGRTRCPNGTQSSRVQGSNGAAAGSVCVACPKGTAGELGTCSNCSAGTVPNAAKTNCGKLTCSDSQVPRKSCAAVPEHKPRSGGRGARYFEEEKIRVREREYKRSV